MKECGVKAEAELVTSININDFIIYLKMILMYV